VGAGLKPTARHSDPAQRSELDQIFEFWAGEADADGRSNFGGIQATVARGLVVDGEVFVHVINTESGSKLRLVPPELIDESYSRELNGGYVVSGVEFDVNATRVAYWIRHDRPFSQFSGYGPPRRVDANEILHIMRPTAAGQVRGISWLAPAILAASDLDQLTDALRVGVKVSAMHAGFLVDQNGLGGEVYEGTDVGGILESGLEPGTLKRLPSGMDVKFNTPAASTAIDAFLKLSLRELAAALGLPVHMLDGDLTGANYSSLRAGLIPFRQRIEQIQTGVLIPQFLRPVWNRAIAHAVFSGQLSAPDYESSPRQYSADWIPPRQLQVDPLKAVNATIAELKNGLTSRRKAVAERGWVLDDLEAELKNERGINAHLKP